MNRYRHLLYLRQNRHDPRSYLQTWQERTAQMGTSDSTICASFQYKPLARYLPPTTASYTCCTSGSVLPSGPMTVTAPPPTSFANLVTMVNFRYGTGPSFNIYLTISCNLLYCIYLIHQLHYHYPDSMKQSILQCESLAANTPISIYGPSSQSPTALYSTGAILHRAVQNLPVLY